MWLCLWQFLKMSNTKNDSSHWVQTINQMRDVKYFLSELKSEPRKQKYFIVIYLHECKEFPSFFWHSTIIIFSSIIQNSQVLQTTVVVGSEKSAVGSSLVCLALTQDTIFSLKRHTLALLFQCVSKRLEIFAASVCGLPFE